MTNVSLPTTATSASVNEDIQLPNGFELSTDEAKQLFSVMMRAKEFEAQEEMQQNRPIEGQLSKYTNVVKGWQFRWFVLKPQIGTFEYYMPEEKRKVHPRGSVYLAGCVISPSDEDSQTFTVSAACGEVYKLKATDAKERQFWVNKLRQVALAHENRIAQQHPPLHQPLGSTSSTSSAQSMMSSSSPIPSSTTSELATSLGAVRDILLQTQKYQRGLVFAIESFTATDEQLLVLKATSHATVMSLEQCFAILQSIRHHRR